ncbi:MAG: DUF84 family protein [Candidatus Saccharibacteria bacterium]
MRIAVGTMSEPKIKYLSDVLDELKIDYKLLPSDVPSGVSEQPISDDETRTGSLNRAKNALAEHKNADIGIGVEVGYHPDSNGDYEIFCWASIVDQTGKQVSEQSHKLLLPEYHQGILKENKLLGDYVRQFLIDYQDEESQNVGIIIRDRRVFIESSIRKVMDKYL